MFSNRTIVTPIVIVHRNRIYGRIYGGRRIYGGGHIYGGCRIYGSRRIYGHGRIYDYDERLRLVLRLYDWKSYDTINDAIESATQIHIPNPQIVLGVETID